MKEMSENSIFTLDLSKANSKKKRKKNQDGLEFRSQMSGGNLDL